MNPYRQKWFIETAKAETGWVYNELPWFTVSQAKQANKIRQKLLQQFGNELQYSSNNTKPHLGPLSPGCQLCGTEAGIFHFLNSVCTRACFFCPQDRKSPEEHSPTTDFTSYDSDEDFIHFLKTFSIKGIGITGGEPLLVLDKLCVLMKAIRKHCGEHIHLRLYTNGDLAGPDVLRILQTAGLDEIRINVSARNYDLTPVRIAKSYIPVVTVEIPAIPEDFEIVKTLLLEMENIGVDYLNLIQLEISKDNFRSIGLHQYHVSHRQFMLPVFESEICALKLMLFKQAKHLRLPISYCGFPYRFEVTNMLRAKRYNQFGLKRWEEITEAGFIRSFNLKKDLKKIAQVLNLFENTLEATGLWWCNTTKTDLRFHHQLLPFIWQVFPDVTIQYYDQAMTKCTKDEFTLSRHLLAEASLSQAATRCWQQIYCEHHNEKEALQAFVRDYPVSQSQPLTYMKDEMRLIEQIGMWEKLEVRYPEPMG
jgi:uncharacterized protein